VAILTSVVGVRHANPDGTDRQDAIHRFARSGARVMLRREPHNRFDPNAVAVYLYGDTWPDGSAISVQIGYLNTALAEQAALLLEGGAELRAEVAGVPGARKRPDGSLYGGTMGVEIWIETVRPAELESPVAPGAAAVTDAGLQQRPVWSRVLGLLRRRDTRRNVMGQGRSGHPDPR